MSTATLARVREVYAEWGRGNMNAGLELFDPEIVFETFMPDASERVVVKGVPGVEAFMREFLSDWRDFRLVSEEFHAIDSDRVVVLGRQVATGRHSGATVDHPMSSAWVFRDGKVVHLVFEPDTPSILEAARVAS
jgi:ketosteroid isomerase-like protein